MIVNYFSHGMVARLLESLDCSTFGDAVVVDNSVDSGEFRNLMRVVEGNGIRAVAMPSNVGFGAAVNAGVDLLNPDADGRIWILNPDTIATSDVAVRLARALDEYGADMASPVICTGVDDEIWFGGGDIDIRRGRTSHWSYRPELVVECDFLTAAAVMISVSAWWRLGGFRADLFMYWEDADLCLRAGELGMRMVVDPAAMIWHEVGATTSTRGKSALYYYYMERNRMVVLADSSGVCCLWSRSALFEAFRILVRAGREPVGRTEKVVSAVRGIASGARYAIRRRGAQVVGAHS
ncbi:glycosyltransferase family 2 protein [Rhodococcus sp. NPDC057529]|uniref:glycosyltransferase family 2 protein n=1 Tax=Rhodococcus sp. NPDC057529 TaxID=3346158 RepID=UPI00366EC8FA